MTSSTFNSPINKLESDEAEASKGPAQSTSFTHPLCPVKLLILFYTRKFVNHSVFEQRVYDNGPVGGSTGNKTLTG